MRIRAAVGDDAPAMGRVMVESFLAAHRGQMPDAAWQKRVKEWTPEVSARGWSRTLAEQGGGTGARKVLLVAEDDAGVLIGLVFGSPVDEEPSRSIAEIGALYVLPDRRGQGVGGSMLRAASRELAALGFSALHVGVLSANLPARTFYEAMGGCEIGSGTSDERGDPLPLTIYGWSDIGALIGRSSETSVADCSGPPALAGPCVLTRVLVGERTHHANKTRPDKPRTGRLRSPQDRSVIIAVPHGTPSHTRRQLAVAGAMNAETGKRDELGAIQADATGWAKGNPARTDSPR